MKSLAGVAWPLGLLLAVVLAIIAAGSWFSADAIPDEDAILERIRPLAELEVEPLPPAAAGGLRTGKDLAQELCQSCHGKGLGGAPKIGDRKALAPRVDQGLEHLVQSVVAGKCGFASSGRSVADRLELPRAIAYMIWPRMRL